MFTHVWIYAQLLVRIDCDQYRSGVRLSVGTKHDKESFSRNTRIIIIIIIIISYRYYIVLFATTVDEVNGSRVFATVFEVTWDIRKSDAIASSAFYSN